MNVLTMKNVSYQYEGAKTLVLKGVNAQFSSGKIYTIIGKSGSGKSTLLSLIASLFIYPHFAFEVTDKNGITTRITDDLKLKYYYRDQLESLIEKAGFTIKESFGWYDRTPINENKKQEIILICESKKY